MKLFLALFINNYIDTVKEDNVLNEAEVSDWNSEEGED